MSALIDGRREEKRRGQREKGLGLLPGRRVREIDNAVPPTQAANNLRDEINAPEQYACGEHADLQRLPAIVRNPKEHLLNLWLLDEIRLTAA
jgi:hypothetical protein